MKIYVNAIPPEGIDMTEVLNPSSLSLETEQVHFPEGVKVTAHVQKDKDIITVDCNVKSTRKQICSRCLSEFDIPVDKDMNFIYKISGEHLIELDDKIKDEIILDYPIRMLCRKACKGLCPQCGKNLNEGPCRCELKTKN